MAAKKLLGSQVKRLLSGVSDHGNQHLTEIETDLAQTTFLLGEAIVKLGASFMAIHQAVSAQQEMVESLISSGVLPPESTARLKEIHGEIGLHVNAAVTGLQFQDMTGQLIGRTLRRVAGLREALDVLGKNGAVMLSEHDTEEIIALLHNINKVFEDQSAQLESLLWKAVHQTHMESGDIDLF